MLSLNVILLSGKPPKIVEPDKNTTAFDVVRPSKITPLIVSALPPLIKPIAGVDALLVLTTREVSFTVPAAL